MKLTKSQRTENAIYNLIVYEKRFLPGEQLPSENKLASLLCVSRATVREAIASLEHKGILRVARGIGTFVADDCKQNEESNISDLDYEKIRLRDLWKARLLFEPTIAEMSCRNASDKEVENIILLSQKVEDVIASNQDRTIADQNFHRAIAAATHNEFLIQTSSVINSAIAESIRIYTITNNLPEHTVIDHDSIVYAFKHRDHIMAKYAMSIHIRRAINDMNLKIEE